MLPGALGEYSQALAKHTETPADLSILAVMGAVSAALGGKLAVEAEPGYIEPGHIWVCPLLESGNRKTAVMDAIRAPIDEYQDDERARLEPDIRRQESERKSNAVIVEKLRKQLTAESSEAERLKVAEMEAALPEERHLPTLCTSDVTAEALEVLMRDNEGRMAVISDEGGMFDVMAGRYNSQPNLDVFLKGHTGGRVAVHRRSRDTFIPHAYLTMCLAPQPVVVQALKDKPFMRERGLLARFLYGMPESPIGTRALNPVPIPLDAHDGYCTLIRRLLKWKPERPVRLSLDSKAYREWKEFQREIERQMGPGGALERLHDWGSKLPGAALRIAGMLHAANDAKWTPAVKRNEIDCATSLCAAIIPHALAVFALVAEDPNVTAAKRILRWLCRQHEPATSKRDCFRALHRQFDTVSDMDAPLAILVDHSYIRLRDLGGKRSFSIEVNPRWRRDEELA